MSDKELLIKINEEEQKIYKEYLIREPYYHWANGKSFTATTYYFWNEFKGKHDFRDWEESSCTSYLSFLISKRNNILLKINRERINRLGKT